LIKAIELAVVAMLMPTGLASLTAAQSAGPYPAEPIRIVVPFGAASGPDFAIRALQPALAEILKQPVRVENRPGANSIICTRAVAAAAPDGYTLLGASTGFSTIESTTSQPGFSPIRDFKPVGFSARSAGSLERVVENHDGWVRDLAFADLRFFMNASCLRRHAEATTGPC
jgi:tripartite-type tricarboxylate transporter receptor subunit TctC